MAETSELTQHLECYVDTARSPTEQVHVPIQFLLQVQLFLLLVKILN